MRKALSCREMGVSSCSFEVMSERNDEIKDALVTHLGKVHSEMAKSMSKEQLDEMMRLMDKKLAA